MSWLIPEWIVAYTVQQAVDLGLDQGSGNRCTQCSTCSLSNHTPAPALAGMHVASLQEGNRPPPSQHAVSLYQGVRQRAQSPVFLTAKLELCPGKQPCPTPCSRAYAAGAGLSRRYMNPFFPVLLLLRNILQKLVATWPKLEGPAWTHCTADHHIAVQLRQFCVTAPGWVDEYPPIGLGMSEVYPLQPVTETFYEREKRFWLEKRLSLKEQLSLEIQGPPSLSRSDEYGKQSWDYLIRYLEERLGKRFFLFAAAVPKSVGPLRLGTAQYRALGLEIILAVARRINATEFESPTLREIAEYLSDMSLLSDVDLKLNIVIAFHVVGWLTGIWDPAYSEPFQRTVNHTTLRIHDGKVPGKRRYYHTDRRAVDRPEVSIAEIEYRKIYHVMAGVFGRLLPYPEQALKRREDRAVERSCDGLQRIYFSWQAMSKLGYEIAWTSTLNDHLRIDQRHRRLFLYQHPSLCRLHYNRGGTNLLTRFFNEEQHERTQQQIEAFDESDFAVDDFFDDLIRSYLVVFGPVTWLLNARPLHPELPQGNRDPLLDTLCSTDRRGVVFSTLFRDFEIPPRDCDVVRFEQFPFLGERLRILGEIGHKGGNPFIPWKLWVEGVHPNGHLYMCIVLVLGIVAVLLQGPQTIASLMGKKCPQQTG